MSEPRKTDEPNAVLAAMLDRLYAALLRGPGLNCRPHRSRQRIDLTQLLDFDDVPPADVLTDLLDPAGGPVRVDANVDRPEDWNDGFWKKRKRQDDEDTSDDAPQNPEAKAKRAAYTKQRKLLSKLRNLSDDARTYQQETGVHALNVGYPLLSVPPSFSGGGRILAPVAFVPVRLAIKAGGRPGITLNTHAVDTDRVVPNPALLAWIERNTGTKIPDDLFDDDAGSEPWREIQTLVRFVADALELPELDAWSFVPPDQRPEPELQSDHPNLPCEPAAEQPFALQTCPNADGLPDPPAVLSVAVLGLFPAGNQGLIRDTREMIANPQTIRGPVLPFLSRTATLSKPQDQADQADDPAHPQDPETPENHQSPRPVALADPCQLRATTLARTHRALVLHGPPGTGKSQTITNVIGDHLARGQRVLFVCDKRTALDVVAHRLDALGLSPLCAVVHDPSRDQRDLYMGIRAQLERLTDLDTHPRANQRLKQIDDEMSAIHAELTELHDALMLRADDRPGLAAESFHELLGRWLGLDAPPLPGAQLDAITVDDLETHRRPIEVALERGNAIVFPHNPWTHAAGTPLDTYLATPVDQLRSTLADCVENASAADQTAHPAIPPFLPQEPLEVQANRRAALLTHLQWIHQHPDEQRLRHAALLDPDALPRMADKLADIQTHRTHLGQALDTELGLRVRDDPPSTRTLAEQLRTLHQYLDVSKKWWSFLAFGIKSRAGKVLESYGLSRTPEHARTLVDFLEGFRARVLLSAAVETLAGAQPTDCVQTDPQLTQTLDHFDHLLPALQLVDNDSVLAPALKQAFTDPEQRATLIAGLEKSPARSDALQQLETSLTSSQLFANDWQQNATAAFRAYQMTTLTEGESPDPTEEAQEEPAAGKPSLPTLERLQQRFDDLETVLRIRDGLASMPQQLRDATANLLQAATPPDQGIDALTKRIIEHTLSARVAAQPPLARLDPQAIDHAFARYAELEKQRREKTVDAVLHRWIDRQKQRLLVGTGTKLNALGASVRQRLYVRGKRAMRLRQVIEVGRNASYDDGGADPVFDLNPVWLASPETVAQCFPREPIFDVVIFDEASQCRLEEALPVLTRAHRVVIAGDPQQLPPTRFFEAAIATSDDVKIEDEDDLFEAQQTEVEDLLAAALNLDVQESYLDVHYRSRNADLIEFSNQHFYKGRLQAIPGHPNRYSRFAPLTLHRADGTYEDRVNPTEADRVVQLVDDLLKRAEPPSIGIACFNLAQRDLIAEALDDRAMADDAFARKLDKARNRDGDASFEGLFVKNLENVQGDERDHIIISTTYGPNAEGKFYRRFGPLAMPGGGRRLNVLVTRARHEVHLVTSIPQSAYLAAAPLPEGANPSGSWLLFAYLRYAEQLEDAYKQLVLVSDATTPDDAPPPQPHQFPTEHPSRFAASLAQRLAEQRQTTTDLYWGNEGFCLDLALHHPKSPGQVTVGALTDFSRYVGPSDAVSWDLYRVGILRWQGWDLHRLWSPTMFRDPQRSVNRLMEHAETHADPDVGDGPHP